MNATGRWITILVVALLLIVGLALLTRHGIETDVNATMTAVYAFPTPP